jgi:hypothetical protein
MYHRCSALLAVSAVVPAALMIVLTVPAAAQAPGGKPHPPAAARQKPSPTPRTPDGRPDLQGVWTNATFTLFERPPSLADKAFFSEAEAAAYEQKRLDEENNHQFTVDDPTTWTRPWTGEVDMRRFPDRIFEYY